MSKREALIELAGEKGGYLRTGDVVAAGISKPTLAEFIREENYERIAHGIYKSPDAWYDAMYLLQLRCPQAIFSHDSALYLHDMTDRTPLRNTITLPTGSYVSGLTSEGVKVYTIKKELLAIGLIHTETPYGNSVAVYDPERTVCDIIRSRSTMDEQVYTDGLKVYVRRQDRDLNKLLDYAKLFHVDSLLGYYLEVLL